MEISIEDKLSRLEKCRMMRNIAAQTCLYTLQDVLNYSRKVSEHQFKTRWLKELNRLYTQGFIGCWYDPPPEGVAVLFSTEENHNRINYSTLRPVDYWPNPKIYFDRKGLGYLFASPFTIADDIPIIGDFGFTYYLGKNQKIIDHFKKCRELMDKICHLITVGMSHREYYHKISDIINQNDLQNNIQSTTDKASTNLGHSIPFIDRNPTVGEFELIQSGDNNRINKTISLARIFINKTEDFVIDENCAFTIEPRLTSTKDKLLPMCSFHTIIQFVEGEKILLTNFKGVFNILGMDWLN